MILKRLFYVSASLLMLAAAYHLGAGTASAQQGSVGFATMAADNGYLFVMTPNGEVYARYPSPTFATGTPLIDLGNYWNGGVTPSRVESMGSLKARYR